MSAVKMTKREAGRLGSQKRWGEVPAVINMRDLTMDERYRVWDLVNTIRKGNVMVKFNSTARAIGTYRCTFTKLETEYTFTNREGEEKTVWRWVFQDVRDSTTVGELDAIANPGFPPRSNNLKFMTGMLGRVPTEKDDTDDLIGRIYDVTWGPNQGGRTTITAVTRVADELEHVMPVPSLKGAALP